MVGVGTPIVIIKCTACGEEFDMKLKHAKFQQWTMPNKTKILAEMREKGWHYTGDDMLCNVCAPYAGYLPE